MGFLVADRLFRERGSDSEGSLTRLKISAVAGETLARVAEERGLGRLIRMGKGAARSGGQNRSSVLENCLEALIGAVYIDRGLDVARDLVMSLLGPYLHGTPVPPADPKSALQEFVQTDGGLPPSYRTIETTGLPHDRTFVVEAVVAGKTVGRGSGASKKDAEKAAAIDALAHLSQHVEDRETER